MGLYGKTFDEQSKSNIYGQTFNPDFKKKKEDVPQLSMQGLREINAQIHDIPFRPTGWSHDPIDGENINTPAPIANTLYTLSAPLMSFMNLPFNQRTGDTATEIMTGVEQNKPSTGSTAGDVTSDILGSVMGFATSRGQASPNIGAGIYKGGENLLGKLLPTLLKKPAQTIGKQALGTIGGSLAFEAGNAATNNDPITAKDFALNAGANVALDLLPLGIGKGLELKATRGLEKQLKYPTLEANPLSDILNSYKSPLFKDAKQANPISHSVQRGADLGPLKLSKTITPEYKARQSELNNTFKDLPIGSVGTPMVQRTLQEGIDNSLGINKPTRQYEGLDAFGKPLNTFRKNTDTQDAISEITSKMTKQVNDIVASLKQMDGQTKTESIRNRVKNMGGIKQGNGDIFEEQTVIPNWIRNDKTGRPLDEVADTLGMDSRELLEAISDSAYKPKDYVSDAYRIAHNDLEYQALSNTLDTLKAELPGKGTIQGTKADIKLKPRELTPKPEPLPIAQPQGLTLSGNLPVDAPLARPVRKLAPIKKEPLQWTNQEQIQARGGQFNPLEVPKLENQQIKPDLESLNLPEAKLQVAAANIETPTASSQNSISAQQPITVANPNEPLPTPQSKIIIGKKKDPFSFKDSLKKFYTSVVNTQQPIYDIGKATGSDIGELASNTKNVSGIIDYNFQKGLVDKNGEKVGDSLQKVVEAIPKGKEEDFWTYMSQRHNIDRARDEYKAVEKTDTKGNQVLERVVTKKPTPVQANYTPEMSTEAVKQIEQAHPEYKAIGDNITSWIDKFMNTWGVDTGVVNKDIYDGLRQTYKSYFPTQRDFSELEKAIPDNVSQKFADQRTPIRKATGSARDIIDPVENIMNLVSRTVRTAKYNEVGQSLLTTVRENHEKMKQFAEIIPTKDGMFANTDNIITVLEKGKPTYLQINNKMLLDSMNGLPKSIGNIPVLSTLTEGFKGLITQKNPIFAIRNIFRDIPTAYVYGSESNPLKFGAGLLGAGKDILTNSPRLQRYKAVGGGGANFFSPGDVTKSAAELMGKGSKRDVLVGKLSDKLGDGKIAKAVTGTTDAVLHPIKTIEKFNNLTETAPRLAEFNRVLEKTSDVTKALFAANDVTVNFSRGGNITKNVDKVVPYMNSGVQGLDKFFRGFINPKTAVSTIVKSGVAITTPTLALYLLNKDNPNYQKLDNRTKDSYYLIPKEDGTFIKLPKSRELGVLFSSLLERGLRQAEGQEDSFKGFSNTVATNFSPANPIDSNFFAPATWNLATNKDFAKRPIVPQSMIMDKRSKYLQYDEKTTAIAKAIAELSAEVIPGGISPKQLDYLVKSYSGVVGQFGIPLVTPGGSLAKTLSTQFTADPTFSNQSTADFYDKLDKLSSTAIDKNITDKIPSKKITTEEDIKNSMQGISSALSRGTKQINRIQAGTDLNKEDEIHAIRKQMLELMGKANTANDPRTMQLIENRANQIFKK